MAQAVFELMASCTTFQYVAHILLMGLDQYVLADSRCRPIGKSAQ